MSENDLNEDEQKRLMKMALTPERSFWLRSMENRGIVAIVTMVILLIASFLFNAAQAEGWASILDWVGAITGRIPQ